MMIHACTKVRLSELAEVLRYHRRTVYRRIRTSAPEWDDMPAEDNPARDPKILIGTAARAFGMSPAYLGILIEGKDSLLTTPETVALLGIPKDTLLQNPVADMIGGKGFRRRYSKGLVTSIARRTAELEQAKGEAA